MRAILILLTCISLHSLLNAQGSIRFFGNGVNAPDQDRAKIQIDEVGNNNPGPPADVGSTDFTIEFWIKATSADNNSSGVVCGNNVNWINGNIVFDRDRYNQNRKFGISIAGGYVVFGISVASDFTVCSSTQVLNNTWRHIAVQRKVSDGAMSIYIDGVLSGSGTGPTGDLSYPDNGVPCNNCCNGGNCNFSDPYIVLGAEKHDAGVAYPSYNGFMDELRISNIIRYTSNFTPATNAYSPDANTMALYHFNEGTGTVINDVSGASGGPSNGFINIGGNPQGPIWSADSPFTGIIDTDNDGIEDGLDNCPTVANPVQSDLDSDGIGDRCDQDEINTNGLGIGTQTPATKLETKGGVYINDLQRGMIMKSADGRCWRVTVSNAGVLTSTLVDCPL